MFNKSAWSGALLFADGMAGLIWPSKYMRILRLGPAPVREAIESLAEKPDTTRVLCLAEIALGAWLIAKEL